MQRRIVKKGSKTYIVNVVGWEDGIGSGGTVGTLWGESISDGYWYSVNVSGPSGSVVPYINSTPTSLISNDLGYQLLYNSFDGNVYQVYLSGSGLSADLLVSQTPWSINNDYKPYLLLQSITDNYFYKVYASGSAGSVELVVDQSGIWMGGGIPPIIAPAAYDFRITEIGDIRITEVGDFRII
jgi:hypothetical protein